MYIARIIGTEIEVIAFDMLIAYNSIREIGGNKCKISLKYCSI